MTTTTINGNEIQWRELSYENARKLKQGIVQGVAYDIPENFNDTDYYGSESYVVAQMFLLHSYSQKPLNIQSPFTEGSIYCREINVERSGCDEGCEKHFSEKNMPEVIKIWNAVVDILQNRCKTKLSQNPANIEISSSFIDHLFRPLIPNTHCLDWSLNRSSSRLMRTVGFFGMLCEVPIRLLTVSAGHLLLSCCQLTCSEEKSNYLSYYKFRLSINAYSPLQGIIKTIYNCFLNSTTRN